MKKLRAIRPGGANPSDELSWLLTAQRGRDCNIQTRYSFDDDRYGNRWEQALTGGTGYQSLHSFNAANNRVTTSGYSSYDGSGNQAATGAGTSYTYNLESLMTASGSSVTYAYDAQNRRKSKTVSGTTTHYFYSGGVVVSELQGSSWTDYIFFGDQRIVKQTGSSASAATYLHADHLGSVRRCTNSAGDSVGSCFYEPFGQVQVGTTCTVPVNYRFAGMEWDAETGLYHTWFRQYDEKQGRWTSVDLLPGSADSPQSLNRYAYVLNDPVNKIDPLGLSHWYCFVDIVPSGSSGTTLTEEGGLVGGEDFYTIYTYCFAGPHIGATPEETLLGRLARRLAEGHGRGDPPCAQNPSAPGCPRNQLNREQSPSVDYECMRLAQIQFINESNAAAARIAGGSLVVATAARLFARALIFGGPQGLTVGAPAALAATGLGFWAIRSGEQLSRAAERAYQNRIQQCTR